MTEPNAAVNGPVLLITDLSPRCDRALDRAVMLAQRNKVKLIALHVIEPSFLSRLLLPSWATTQKQHQQAAQQRLLEDLQHAEVDLEVVVEIGYPIDVIKAVASKYKCSLIVSGTARDEALGRIMLGSTVERVARESTIPLLVVRRRPEPVYDKVLAGTDFSEGARQALTTAVNLIPFDSLTLFHSFSEVAGVKDLDESTIKERTEFLEAKAMEFAQSVPGAATDHLKVVVSHGDPAKDIPAYVNENHIELVVLGTRGMSGIIKTAMGTVAEQLLLLLRSDVLIVPTRH